MNTRMFFTDKVNGYMDKGYSEMMAHFFVKCEIYAEAKAHRERDDEELGREGEEKFENKKIIKSQMERLDKLIKINHDKLNKWFHLDNPNGFAFPDEVWGLIKTYNPEPIKLKCNGMIVKKFKDIYLDSGNGGNGSWFLLDAKTHYRTLRKILEPFTNRHDSVRRHDFLKEHNCSKDEMIKHLMKKRYIKWEYDDDIWDQISEAEPSWERPFKVNWEAELSNVYTTIPASNGFGEYFTFAYISAISANYVKATIVQYYKEYNINFDETDDDEEVDEVGWVMQGTTTLKKKIKRDSAGGMMKWIDLNTKNKTQLRTNNIHIDNMEHSLLHLHHAIPMMMVEGVDPNGDPAKVFNEMVMKDEKLKKLSEKDEYEIFHLVPQ